MPYFLAIIAQHAIAIVVHESVLPFNLQPPMSNHCHNSLLGPIRPGHGSCIYEKLPFDAYPVNLINVILPAMSGSSDGNAFLQCPVYKVTTLSAPTVFAGAVYADTSDFAHLCESLIQSSKVLGCVCLCGFSGRLSALSYTVNVSLVLPFQVTAFDFGEVFMTAVVGVLVNTTAWPRRFSCEATVL